MYLYYNLSTMIRHDWNQIRISRSYYLLSCIKNIIWLSYSIMLLQKVTFLISKKIAEINPCYICPLKTKHICINICIWACTGCDRNVAWYVCVFYFTNTKWLYSCLYIHVICKTMHAKELDFTNINLIILMRLTELHF